MPFATTLLTLKQSALQTYKSRQYVTGQVASFSTTSIVDLTRQEPVGEFDRVDSYIRFTSGPAIGAEARVMGWSPATSYVLFAPSVPSLNASTNYYIAKTFNNTDMNLAVNETLQNAAPERRIQSFATAAETGGIQTLAVPSAAGNAMTNIVRVDRSFGTINSLYDFRQIYEGSDYSVDIDSGNYTLRLNYPAVSGNVMRFHYRRDVGTLTVDTDSTDEPLNLITAGIKKWMAEQEGDDIAARKYAAEFEEAKKSYARNMPVQTLKTPRIGVLGYGGGRTGYGGWRW